MRATVASLADRRGIAARVALATATLVSVLLVGLPAPARAALSWSAPVTIDSNAPDVLYGVACPSASQCTAVDVSGQEVTGTGVPAPPPPSASVSAPASGQRFGLGQVVATSFSCSEGSGGPGIASCTDSNGASAPHGALNTATAGAHTYTVTARSLDGQAASAQIGYTVAAASPPPQSTTVSFGNQQITLRTPSLLVCTASSKTLGVSLSSTTIAKSKAAKLKFVSAAFYLDKGVKHTKHKTVRTRNGKRRKVIVITYTANATAHHLPVTLALKLAGLKRGTHTLTVKLSYKQTKHKHGHKTTVTVTKTLRQKFLVC